MIRAALAVILLWQITIGTLYAVRIPAWQAPDEPAHFNYARQIATGGGLPVLHPGDYDQNYLEALKAGKFPPALPIDPVRYEGHQPPGYYLLAAPLIALAGPDVGRELTAVRLLSVALGAVLVMLIFSMVRLLLPDRPALALIAAAFPAIIPQHIAIFASASNDALASVSVALALLLTIRLVVQVRREKREIGVGVGLGLGLALALCVLAKITAYVVIPVAVIGLLWAGGRRALAAAITALIPPFVVGLAWAGRNISLYGPLDPLGLARHDSIVTGQPLTGTWTFATVRALIGTGFQSFWGQFGWMGVLMDGWVYGLLWAGVVLALVGFVCFAVDVRRGNQPVDAAGRIGIALLALTFAGIAAGFLWYNLRYLQPQGRYFFAAMPAIAFVLAAGLRWAFSERYGFLFVGMTVGGLAALDVLALFRYILPQLAN